MKRILTALELTDGYKLDHRRQYPEGTEYVYSNETARSCTYFPEAEDGIVVSGIQYMTKEYLVKRFNETFFNLPKEEAVFLFARRINTFLGENQVGTKHIEDLHDLGYLPIEIKALPEGALCPIKVPFMTMKNTHPDFFWVTNFLETLISNTTWMPITSATSARLYKKELKRHADKTGFGNEFLGFFCHDFSMRGMGCLESSIISGMGHLTSFTGSETIPAIWAMEEYYGADAEKELIAGTIPATEHSVMCAGGNETELDSYKRLLTEIYPKGFVSIVSDTWDYWRVITEYLPELKDIIEARDGRFVVRPDSGDPVDIICGTSQFGVHFNNRDSDGFENYNRYKKFFNRTAVSESAYKGTYELLWDIFGGTINKSGYKVLNPKIGMIYGDSITLERQKEIYKRLEAKGFAATNLVLGVGSYTYQFKSRDSLGMAVKSTWCQVNGEGREIFKDPKTDNGVKKSLKGLIKVEKDENGKYFAINQVTPEEEKGGELKTVFKDGVITREFTLQEIRNNVDKTL